MASDIPPELNRQKHVIIHGMLNYLAGDPDCAEYTEEDVESCDARLSAFLTTMTPGLGPNAIMAAIRDLVLSLNALNDRCGGTLIETDAREDICELIIMAQQVAGLTEDEDITGEWREW